MPHPSTYRVGGGGMRRPSCPNGPSLWRLTDRPGPLIYQNYAPQASRDWPGGRPARHDSSESRGGWVRRAGWVWKGSRRMGALRTPPPCRSQFAIAGAGTSTGVLIPVKHIAWTLIQFDSNRTIQVIENENITILSIRNQYVTSSADTSPAHRRGGGYQPPPQMFFVDKGKTAMRSAVKFDMTIFYLFYTLCASCDLLP